MAAFGTELRLQQLEARLGNVEQALRSLQQSGTRGPESDERDSKLRHLETLQKELEDGFSVSSSELLLTQSEKFEEALFTASGDEIRAGIVTKGPCYELQHSVWDASLCIGLPALSVWDSVLAAFLLLLNIVTQLGFVLVVRERLLEDVLKPEQLTELLRFRTNVAHDVKYADLVGGRSMTRQVCTQDESLQWANAQSGVISDLNDYNSVGPVLAMLAIGCWLSTTLKELFNVLGFVGAVRKFPVGESTKMIPDGEDGDGAVITEISQSRKLLLYGLVALPRMFVAVVLSVTGTRYLANTLSLADLILNAVALAFILDLDELIESAFMPRRARFLLDAVGTLPIPRLEIPGLGHMRGGLQERWKNLLKIALLLVGLLLTWYCLLQPLRDRVQLAVNILCSGRQDFIYTVNSATGLIEATQTYEEDVALTPQQKSVLRLADLKLYSVDDWFSRSQIEGFYEDGDAALLHRSSDEATPNMHLIHQLVMLEKSDVSEAATRLPCADMAFPEGLVREQLRSVTGGKVENCSALATNDEFCSQLAMNSVRALCPQTCGCNQPFRAAAGAFATVPFGCPKMCTAQREVSPELAEAPCTDWSVEQILSSDYMHRVVNGLNSLKLGREETRKVTAAQYVRALNSSFYNLLPGPNRTASLLRAAEFYENGSWYQALAKGNYILGLGVPHPRGLRGCEFFASDEVMAVAGGSLCAARTDVDLIVSIRPQCPVSCGCKRGDKDCPGTCRMI